MTIKQKYYGSIGLVVILLLALWKFGIQKTINLRAELHQNQVLNQRIENADILIRQYQTAIDRYGDVGNDTASYSDEGLFSQVERIVAKYKGDIIAYQPQVDKALDNALIKTKKIQITGDYYDLVQCLHEIESNPALTKVLSSKIEMVEDRKTRKSYLVLEMYIQNVIMS